jgi:hypothetical protein
MADRSKRRKRQQAKRVRGDGPVPVSPEFRGAAPPVSTGETEIQATRGDMALVKYAVRQRWPISDEVRKDLVSQMSSVMKNSQNDRDRVAAAKVIALADDINLKDEGLRHQRRVAKEERLNKSNGNSASNSGPSVVVQVAGQNVAVGVDATRVMREELLRDPDYLGYLRNRVIEGNSNPGAVRESGVGGPVENGPPPDAIG